MESAGRYLLILCLTVVVECLVALLLRHLRGPAPQRLMDVVWINLISHPVANLVAVETNTPFLLIEFLVVAAEAALYSHVCGLRLSHAIFVAIFLNFVTAALSFVF